MLLSLVNAFKWLLFFTDTAISGFEAAAIMHNVNICSGGLVGFFAAASEGTPVINKLLICATPVGNIPGKCFASMSISEAKSLECESWDKQFINLCPQKDTGHAELSMSKGRVWNSLV